MGATAVRGIVSAAVSTGLATAWYDQSGNPVTLESTDTIEVRAYSVSGTGTVTTVHGYFGTTTDARTLIRHEAIGAAVESLSLGDYGARGPKGLNLLFDAGGAGNIRAVVHGFIHKP